MFQLDRGNEIGKQMIQLDMALGLKAMRQVLKYAEQKGKGGEDSEIRHDKEAVSVRRRIREIEKRYRALRG